MPDDDDGVLIRRYLEGNAEAFEALVRRHAPVVLGFLRSRTRDPALAEDLTQEVFMRALEGLRRYTHRRKLRAWLMQIARNLAIDRERRAAGARFVAIETPVMADNPDGPTLGDTLAGPERLEPARIAETRMLADAARAVLETLHPVQREVFVMRQAGVSFREIARMQECSVNTALGRMHDAVSHLRRKLAELEEGT